MNLLEMLHRGEITLEQAESKFDEIIMKIHQGQSPPDWRVTLELSNYEATAYAYGASLADLVKFRYEGWPEFCCNCTNPIDYRQYGWVFSHYSNGSPGIKQIECPLSNLGQLVPM